MTIFYTENLTRKVDLLNLKFSVDRNFLTRMPQKTSDLAGIFPHRIGKKIPPT